MRRLRLLIIFFVCLVIPLQSALGQAPVGNPQAPNAWTPVAPGVDFQIFNLGTPEYPRKIQIFVTRADPSNPNVTIDTGIATGKIASGRDTVLNMAAHYDQAINYWGQQWGNRNQVVAAINGYYFDQTTGEPISGVVNNSWHAHRYLWTVGDAGFAWTMNRQAFIGSCVYYVAEKNDITFPAAGYDPNLAGVNISRTDEQFILYTQQFDSDTNTVPSDTEPVLELVVQLERPALLISDPSYVKGFVREIRNNKGSTPIPFDSVVLAFWGDVRAAALSRVNSGTIQVGSEVQLTQEVTDCPDPTIPARPWGKTYAALGGDYHFLTDTVLRTNFSNPDAAVPNSRTAVAFKRNGDLIEYIYFIVVDGFNPDSLGMTIPELANWVKFSLGATDGVALDSGGSSTMVVNNAVVNNTTCNFTRDCKVLAADGSNPADALMPLDQTYGVSWTDETGLVEPLVGTSLMMIVSQPISTSHTFTFTQDVLITQPTPVRLGPGSNYAATSSAGAGLVGQIVDHFSSLDGVMAKGDYWWYVDFNDAAGWVREADMLNLTPVRLGNDVFLPSVNLNAIQTQAATNARLALAGGWLLSEAIIAPDIPADYPPDAGKFIDPITDPRRFPPYFQP